MSRTQDLQTLADTGQARPAASTMIRPRRQRQPKIAAPTLTKREMLTIAADGYNGHLNETFCGMYQIEYWRYRKLTNTLAAKSPLQPAVKALEKHGVVIDGTIGGFMRSVGLSQQDVHDIACNCRGNEVSGATIKARFMGLANKAA